MASIVSAGIGSGLDVQSLVAQLVAAERTPATQRLGLAQSKAQVQLSALGTYRSALAGFKEAAAALASGGSLSALTAKASDEDLFSATADGAVAGSYDLEVVELAQAHKLVSGAYGSANTALGAGSVSIDVGGESFVVNLALGSDTLGHLRDAINAHEDNPGVRATLANEVGGTRLLLTSQETGEDHEIQVSSSLIALSERQAARDAHIRVEGYDRYSSSNTIEGAIDGVTLKLLKAEPGTTARLDVAVDDTAVEKAIGDFVKAYNLVVTTAATQTRYDAAKKQAGALAGNSAVRGAQQQLRSILGDAAEGGRFEYLSQVGLTLQADGTLKLDAGKLDAALASDPEAVRGLFAGADGFATRLSAQLEGLLEDDGQIDAVNDRLQAQLADIAEQRTALDLRMESVEQRYLAQFTALDAMISRMRSTGDFLSQQLGSLQAM